MALDKHFTAYCCEWTYVYFGTENVQNERKCSGTGFEESASLFRAFYDTVKVDHSCQTSKCFANKIGF